MFLLKIWDRHLNFGATRWRHAAHWRRLVRHSRNGGLRSHYYYQFALLLFVYTSSCLFRIRRILWTSSSLVVSSFLKIFETCSSIGLAISIFVSSHSDACLTAKNTTFPLFFHDKNLFFTTDIDTFLSIIVNMYLYCFNISKNLSKIITSR